MSSFKCFEQRAYHTFVTAILEQCSTGRVDEAVCCMMFRR